VGAERLAREHWVRHAFHNVTLPAGSSGSSSIASVNNDSSNTSSNTSGGGSAHVRVNGAQAWQQFPVAAARPPPL